MLNQCHLPWNFYHGLRSFLWNKFVSSSKWHSFKYLKAKLERPIICCQGCNDLFTLFLPINYTFEDSRDYFWLGHCNIPSTKQELNISFPQGKKLSPCFPFPDQYPSLILYKMWVLDSLPSRLASSGKTSKFTKKSLQTQCPEINFPDMIWPAE